MNKIDSEFIPGWVEKGRLFRSTRRMLASTCDTVPSLWTKATGWRHFSDLANKSYSRFNLLALSAAEPPALVVVLIKKTCAGLTLFQWSFSSAIIAESERRVAP